MLVLLRFALADLRGGLSRFAVLLACLALGVGTVAMVGAVGTSLNAALGQDARTMLGGDVEVRLSYRRIGSDERALLASLGTVSEAIDFVARPKAGDVSTFAMVRAVDGAYPLLGSVEFTGAGSLTDALATRDGVPGALVGPGIVDKLGIEPGDAISIGDASYQIRGILQITPDQVSQGITIGSPILVSTASLETTDLLQEGALSRYRYRVLLASGLTWTDAAERIREAFPDAGWQITEPSRVTDELGRYFDLFGRFLIVVGMSAMMLGGIGVSNAVSAYIAERQATIATMKSLGATRARILQHFLLQACFLTALGVTIGLALGALLTLVVLPLLGPSVGLALSPTIDWSSLGLAAAMGWLSSFVFAYLPLYRAQATPAGILFRSLGAVPGASLTGADYLAPAFSVPMLVAVAGLVGLATIATGSLSLVAWYAVGLGVAFAVLSLSARALRKVLRSVPPLPDARLRNAVKAVYRPGTPAPIVMLSFGLGLALLVLVATIVNDIRHQLDPEVRVDAPNFVYMDLFEDEEQALAAFAASEPRIERYSANPVLRSSGLSINGGPSITPGQITRDISTFFGDEQPLSTSITLPGGNRLVAGSWWPPDYEGPNLLGVSESMAAALDLKLGDRITFAVSGDEITAEVSAIRRYDWQKGRINFPFVLSPQAFDFFPVAWFAFIRTQPGVSGDVERELTETFPDLVYIPVEEALDSVLWMITGFSNATAIVGAVAVSSGLLVLAGALASRRRQREEEAVIAKVLGATRGDLVQAYLLEYGVVGVISAFLATGLGVAGAWLFATRIIETRFSVDPGLLVAVVGIAVVTTTFVGAATMWSTLSVSPGERLRQG